MNDMRFLRQQDVVDAEKLANLQVTLIGLGSIGSVTGLYLTKMGICNLTAFDADVVEKHNWSNQLYSEEDIGLTKAVAFRKLLDMYGSIQPRIQSERYVDQSLSEVVISAVDSMKSREIIWKSIRVEPQVKLYIDARMGLETLVVHSVRPQIREDRVRYSQTIVSDDQAFQEPCTARTICYTPLMAASVVCNLLKRFVNHEQVPGQVTLDLATYALIA